MIRCIIIDDEPAAREVLKSFISKCSTLELVNSFSSSLSARPYLKEYKTDLIFLDIEMPHMNGIELLKSLNNPPVVIFTTAYPDYALDGYDLNVLDYLLKPISIQRFLEAVDKAEKRLNPQKKKDNRLTVKADQRVYQINLSDILYAESRGDYITLHTKEKTITFCQTLKSLCEELPSHYFSRVHKSFMVRLASIDYLEGNHIKIGEHTIPVGKKYKESFISLYVQ